MTTTRVRDLLPRAAFRLRAELLSDRDLVQQAVALGYGTVSAMAAGVGFGPKSRRLRFSADAVCEGTVARMNQLEKPGAATGQVKYGPRRAAGVLTSAASCALILSSCALSGPSPLPYLDVRPPVPSAEVAPLQCPRDGVGLGADGADTGPVPTPGTLPSTFKPELVRYCRLVGDSMQVSGGRATPWPSRPLPSTLACSAA